MKQSEKGPERPPYTLAELMAECDPNAPMPQDTAEWDRMPPVGREWPNAEVIVEREGNGFVARSLDPDVASDGATEEEALANLRQALELYHQQDCE